MCAIGKHESLKFSNKNIPWKVNPEALTDFFKKKNIVLVWIPSLYSVSFSHRKCFLMRKEKIFPLKFLR